MKPSQWAWLVGSIVVAVFTVIMAAGGWNELSTPAQVGAMVVNGANVIVAFFKPSPKQ